MNERDNSSSQVEQMIANISFRSFYRTFLSSLKERGNSNNAMALCPFHDDHNPSLSVNLETGLWNCFACGEKGNASGFYMRLNGHSSTTAKEIAGMTYTTFSGEGKGKVVATYMYRDHSGETLYIKERTEPGKGGRTKEFRFKHRKDGRWTSGRGGDPALYNLPDLAGKEQIFIVEGEGKVERLREFGLTATCLDTGAESSWRKEYLTVLGGKEEIIILPDNDDAGRSYSKTIVAALRGKVEKIKVVELPGLGEGEDIIDWAKKYGNGAGKLREIVEATPPLSPQEDLIVLSGEEDTKDPLDPDEHPFFPENAWRGVFDTYRKAMDHSTNASDVAHFLALWAAMAAKLRRRVRFYYGMDLYPNGQFVYYGETGDKKTTATKRSISLIEKDKQVRVLQGVGSGEGLADWLGKGGSSVSHLLYLSELSELLKRGSWDKATLKTVLTNLYDCPSVYEVPFRNKSILIREPTLTLLACTTPALFGQETSDHDIYNGFVNRMLFVTGCPKEAIALPTTPVAGLLARVEADIEGALQGLPSETLDMSYSTASKELWESFYRDWQYRDWPPLVKAALTRIDSYILKLAMVYSVLEGTAPEINPDQLNAAISVGEYAARCTEHLILKYQRKSRTVQLEDRIYDAIKSKPGITRRELQRKVGGCSSQAFNRALDEMKRAGKIREKEGDRNNRWLYYPGE